MNIFVSSGLDARSFKESGIIDLFDGVCLHYRFLATSAKTDQYTQNEELKLGVHEAKHTPRLI